jgi:N-acetylmuramic acid 6-phosphate (MurNAc-6-P) etherase
METKIEYKKLYKETNEKFVQRVEHMLYYICGCNAKRGREVLKECLKRNKEKLKND